MNIDEINDLALINSDKYYDITDIRDEAHYEAVRKSFIDGFNKAIDYIKETQCTCFGRYTCNNCDKLKDN